MLPHDKISQQCRLLLLQLTEKGYFNSMSPATINSFEQQLTSILQQSISKPREKRLIADDNQQYDLFNLRLPSAFPTNQINFVLQLEWSYTQQQIHINGIQVTQANQPWFFVNIDHDNVPQSDTLLVQETENLKNDKYTNNSGKTKIKHNRNVKIRKDNSQPNNKKVRR